MPFPFSEREEKLLTYGERRILQALQGKKVNITGRIELSTVYGIFWQEKVHILRHGWIAHNDGRALSDEEEIYAETQR